MTRLHTRSGALLVPTEVRYHHARLDADLRFDGEEGTFAGYGSIHGVRDSYGTEMRQGCWTNGGLDSDPYALLWMHNPDVVLGTFTAREDETGLWVEGRYDDTPEGTAARTRAISGSAPGLSVGFNVVAIADDDPDAFTACRLVEVSQITARMASTPGAELASVRKAQAANDSIRKARTAAARLALTEFRR